MKLVFVYARAFDATTRHAFREERERDEWLSRAETVLLQQPEAGTLLPRTGGARKLRVALPGRGKRGGGRVIYL